MVTVGIIFIIAMLSIAFAVDTRGKKYYDSYLTREKRKGWN